MTIHATPSDTDDDILPCCGRQMIELPLDDYTTYHWEKVNCEGKLDLTAYIGRQITWSLPTFGPARRTGGLIEHIAKELEEIRADPTDLYEWIDVIILAIDGAWRAGYDPKDIVKALRIKQQRNLNRKWPDWRNGSEDHAIEHDRSEEKIHPFGRA